MGPIVCDVFEVVEQRSDLFLDVSLGNEKVSSSLFIKERKNTKVSVSEFHFKKRYVSTFEQILH